MRVGNIAGEGVTLTPGAEITLTLDDVPGDEHQINLPVPEIFEAVRVGTHLMLDDGLLELRVKSKRDDALVCEVVVGGLLTSHKGVNVPGVSLPIAAVTDKDLEDLQIRHRAESGLCRGVVCPLGQRHRRPARRLRGGARQNPHHRQD